MTKVVNDGRLFAVVDSEGKPLTRRVRYATAEWWRRSWDRLGERLTQKDRHASRPWYEKYGK